MGGGLAERILAFSHLPPCLVKTKQKEGAQEMEVRYPEVEVPMIGEDGNALAIIGRVSKALGRAGVSPEEVEEFKNEAMSGDYDELLQTVIRWVSPN
jgi:hypothetical protein